MKPEDFAKSGKEYGHQVALFVWAALNQQKYPELKLMFAIKNEEKSGSAIVGARNKASGCKKGIPDILLPVARQGVHGLFIEMKRPGEKPRKEQFEKMKELEDQHYIATWFDSWEKASQFIIWYLK